MQPDAFVAKWQAVTASEHAVAQTHFNELCDLLDVPKPLEADPTGEHYAFERSVRKAARGRGFTDVWKRDTFAWEYKSRGRDLGDAYRQLLLYRDDLDNPPLLVVSDIDEIQVHTNFTGTTKAIHTCNLDDLLDPVKRADLRKVWTHPNSFNPRERRERITQDATYEIGRIALSLRGRGHEPQAVAHFMMQLVFALFAEDIRLLPNRLVTKILERSTNPQRVQEYLSNLFQAMSVGGEMLLEDIEHFNGGLFDGTPALELTVQEITYLHEAAQMDWAEVEPAIFGTLFERSLDPAKRSQLGAHYTSREDILRIVEPVVMQPLRRRWHEVRDAAEAFLADPPATERTAKRQRAEKVDKPISDLLSHLHSVRVLDPACGSGNFLYVALQALKDLEHEVVTFAEHVGAPGFRLAGPRQFRGIELNPFARELASMVVWIGFLQWNRANGISNAQRPVLEPLQNIRLHDALMNDNGTEYEWPEAEFIIGNPPFIGGKRLRSELGEMYVDRLFDTFDGRVPREADFVTYWFEKARRAIEHGNGGRAGLIATNSIRGGANRRVLQAVQESGDIFMAWSDEPWVLDGASVRVSLVGFNDGTDSTRYLNGRPVARINSDLTSGIDVKAAQRLRQNAGRSFMGNTKGGPFDVPGEVARAWLAVPNADGRRNDAVLKPWVNGLDVMRRPRDMWIIDFGTMSAEEASKYAVPWAYVEQHVRPMRATNRREAYRTRWWRHVEVRPAMRAALQGLERYIATPTVAKHRVFVWLSAHVVADHQLIAFAAEDDFTFGVLHSRLHEVWSLAQGTSLGVGNDPRYTPSTCFGTYPFPSPNDEQQAAIAGAGSHLDQVRSHLLAVDKTLTVTRLYNEVVQLRSNRDATARACPLLLAHEALDQVVAEAYGWEWPLADQAIVERLLTLNLAIAGSSAAHTTALTSAP